MAFMSQERKAGIAAELKRVIPKGWKYSLAVRHHSTIVLTIAAAPVDLLGMMKAASAKRVEVDGHSDPLAGAKYAQVNTYYPNRSGIPADLLEPILEALNRGNHDRSDLQTDYFDVGWYAEVSVGSWNKPFVFIGHEAEAVAA